MKSPRPSLPMTGGCQCGAIRYEIASFPLLLYTCKCTDCQRQTGSAFALNMPVRSGDFRILQGEPNGWHHTSPNGTPVIRWIDPAARRFSRHPFPIRWRALRLKFIRLRK